MPQVSYPGVYIQEMPSTARSIASVSTSIAAFVDFFREGPMDQAVQIFGMADFDRVFGGLDDRSEASYAISQFFLNGGTEALVVRCAAFDAGHPLGSANVKVKASTTVGGDVLVITAISAGVWGNTLRAEVDLQGAGVGNFNLTVTRYDGPGNSAQLIGNEKFLNLSLNPASPRNAIRIVNDESRLVHIALGSAAASNSIPFANGTVSGDHSGLTAVQLQTLLDAAANKKIRIQFGIHGPFVATLGSWVANEITTLSQLATKLEQAIRTASHATVPGTPTPAALTGANVYAVGGKQLIVVAGRSDSDYNPVNTLVFTNDVSSNEADDLRLTSGRGAEDNVQQYPLGHSAASVKAYVKDATGGDGMEPGADEIVGAVAQANGRGMYALEKMDLFNVLCIPRSANLADAQMNTVVSKALEYCVHRRAFMIIDIPKTINEVQEMKDWISVHSGVRHTNAAVYFPRPKIPDPKDEYRLRSVGVSGTLAGIYARTDSQRGVWKTPAGIEAVLIGAPELDAKITDAQNGTLNPLGINCLRTFPIYGNISWGGRTTRGADAEASEWKYLSVRRLALMIEESLFRGTKWVVFEGNDEKLWGKIRLNVGVFMMSLFRQGAFQGTDPKKAFYVKCDKETTTQADINLGIVNIEVGFAPLKPAEFVVIKMQQMAGELE